MIAWCSTQMSSSSLLFQFWMMCSMKQELITQKTSIDFWNLHRAKWIEMLLMIFMISSCIRTKFSSNNLYTNKMKSVNHWKLKGKIFNTKFKELRWIWEESKTPSKIFNKKENMMMRKIMKNSNKLILLKMRAPD